MTQLNPLQPFAKPRNHGLAIASLVLGILALAGSPCGWCCCAGGMDLAMAVLAVVFGHTAFSQIRRAQGALTGTGMATAGLVCGYLALALSLMMMAVSIFFGLISMAKGGHPGVFHHHWQM